MNKVISKYDINGFFGLFMNNLTNLLVLTSLLVFVVGLPKEIVYAHILPGLGIALFFASCVYTYMGYQLREKSQKARVTALPSGVSVAHMYLIVFMVVGPIYWKTNDPYLAWYAGLAWCFIEGIVELFGSIVGKSLRNAIPRPALLGSLAGVSLTFILLNPAFSIFAIPYIGLITFTFVLLSWFGKAKMPFNIPVGLLVIIIGVVVGWLTQTMDYQVLKESLNGFSFHVPNLQFEGIWKGLNEAGSLLIIAIPFGIYNFIETIDNVESAEAAGDHYNVTSALVFDGISTIISALFGSVFPVAVYIGHPGWKATGARIGYTLLTGICVLLITITGSLNFLLSLLPVVALEPVLIYIGIIITTQAFEVSNVKYYPAIIVAFIPWLADWSQNVVDIGLTSAKTNAQDIGNAVLNSNGLNYAGVSALGAGSILVSILWACIVIFIIDKQYIKLAIASCIAAILSFVGVIHSEVIKINANGEMAITYLIMMAIFIGYYVYDKKVAKML
ncbi:MAG: hypothetical protein ACK5KR_01835 [Breznakia sp.]